ncbi:hypothetical protein J3R85_002671 [Psidium guajava]|nr:hypothetical protein J3R85_002671 [Psidium guajava]
MIRRARIARVRSLPFRGQSSCSSRGLCASRTRYAVSRFSLCHTASLCYSLYTWKLASVFRILREFWLLCFHGGYESVFCAYVVGLGHFQNASSFFSLTS